MIRQGLLLRLKPKALAEYKRHHDEIPKKWPELAAKIKECGIKNIRTFEADPFLFLYAEVEDENSFPRLWDTEIHKKWAKVMDPLIELDAQGKPDARFLKQIFNFEA